MKHRLLCLAACMLLAPITALAQITGVLSGKVTDDEGKAVIGATIRIVGTTQGGFSKAPEGKFTIAGIRAGDYDITITAVGYQTITRKTRISAGQTTELNVKLSTKAVQGKEIVVRDTRIVKPEQTGTVRQIGREELDRSTRTSIVGAVALENSVSTAGQNGFSIRGGRATETAVRVDGVDVGDPFVGGFGSTSASLYPTVSTLAVQEIQVMASSFDAQYGDILSGEVNSVTRAGRNDRYDGAFRFRTQVPALYGSSQDITVKKAGTTIDTTLAGSKLQGSGTQLYEFAFGGPFPGFNSLTFFFTGKYEPRKFTGASYEVYDVSPEYAQARSALAKSLWGYSLEPTNLGQMPHQQTMVRDVLGKLKLNITDEIFVEASGEIGLTSRELGGWSNIYQLEHPIFTRNGVNDTVTSLVERDMQQVDQNTIINRALIRYFQTLDQASFFELTGAWVYNKYVVGEKDETKEYGMFDVYDIYDGTEADADLNRNVAIDRYEYVNNRNAITGLYEGAEANGASRNPYGLNDLNFPVHGNKRSLEKRESTTLTFTGNYETNLDFGDLKTQIRTGFDFKTLTLRRHQNSLPWDEDPFFDVYGYKSNYFIDKETTGRLASFFENPYTPWEGALYVQTRFNYKSIIFSPGVRFDFMNPNTQAPPPIRGTFAEVIRSLDSVGDASLKFQVSPRVGVSYPVTDNSYFRVNFAMMFKMPDYNLLYDGAYDAALRQGKLFGNPDIDPQKVFNYEIAYQASFADIYSIDVAAFYRDIYNQSGVTAVQVLPNPYTIYTVQEYGNVRGLEISLNRNLADNFLVSINYTLQKAVGTASDPTANFGVLSGEADPYTGESRKVALEEFPLDYDQTHSLKATLSLVWGDGEGPSIGGLKLLENTDVTFTTTFGTGLPYTRTDTKGQQVGQYNGERGPSGFTTEAHIERGFKLRDLFGESAGNLELSVYADVINLFNANGPSGYYTTTGSPDANGTSMARQRGDFTATPFYKDVDPARPETFDSRQLDEYGNRFYNPYADLNVDGVVTQDEKYVGFQRFVATIQSLHGNYTTPRTVAVGFRIQF